MAAEDSFNKGIILPDLITHLKRILEQYPDNGQILKELIQNAEDAGAEEIRFFLDTNQYGTDPEQLCAEGLGRFQGPALLVYNDAVFSDDDWRGIRMLLDSVKRDDPMKVGRFGLGFKSVFHLTDMPSILSGEWLGFLDPHQIHFERDVEGSKVGRKETTSAYRIHLSEREILETKRQQLEPFCHNLFHSDLSEIMQNGYFRGTVLRFPLRNSEALSDLCDTIYTVEKVISLFDALKIECHLNLIFLKNLASIQLYTNFEQNGAQTLFEVFLAAECKQKIEDERKQFIHKVTMTIDQKQGEMTSNSARQAHESVSTVYPMSITTVDHDKDITSEDSFLVSQYLSCSSTSKIPNKSCLPWAGVAISTGGDFPITHGRIFCFLPLPTEQREPTGLQFHVNGFFAVDQNRHHLKMPSSDQSKRDDDVQWNMFLASELIPKAVTNLALYIKEIPNGIPSSWMLIQNLIPDYDHVTEYWQAVLPQLCTQFLEKNIFFSEVNGGQWTSWSKALFFDPQVRVNDTLKRMLLLSNHLLVLPTSSHLIKSMIASGCPKPSYIKPALVAKSFLKVQGSINISSAERKEILAYIIHNDLKGLALLPLKDGTYTTFNRGETVYVAEPDTIANIFPDIPNKFVDFTDMTEDCEKTIRQLAQNGKYQLRLYSPKYFHSLLKLMMEPYATSQRTVEICSEKLGPKWLENIWVYVQKHHVHLTCLLGLPLLPFSNHLMTRIQFDEPVVIGSSNEVGTVPPDVIVILKHLGMIVVDCLPWFIENHKPCFSEDFLFKPNAGAIIKAVGKVWKNRQSSIVKAFSTLSHFQVSAWTQYMANHCSELRDKMSVEILRSLPMFPLLGKTNLMPAACAHFCTDKSNVSFPLKDDVFASDATSKKLLVLLNVKFLTKLDVLQLVVVPTLKQDPSFYSHNDAATIEKAILTSLSKEVYVDRSFLTQLNTLEFMSSRTGSRCSPNALFNPHGEELLEQLLPQDQLPSLSACHADYRRALQSLAMKTRSSMTGSDYLTIASSLSLEQDNRLEKAKLFAQLMEQNHHHFLKKDFMENMCQLPWVPVQNDRGEISYHEDLPLLGEEIPDSVACPNEIKSDEYAHVVGAVQCLVSRKQFPRLTACFSWNSPPSTKNVLEQLQIISTNASDLNMHYSSINAIYSILMRRSHGEIRTALTQLDFQAWVYHRGGFCTIDQLATKPTSLNLVPYAFGLPKKMQKFSELFLSQGSKEHPDFFSVLGMIAECHVDQSPERSEQDLTMVISILKHMADSGTKPRDDMPIPVHHSGDFLKFKEKQACTYQDAGDAGMLLDTVDDDTVLHFVHEALPSKIIVWLEVRSLVSRVVQADDMIMSYGQGEPLTRRLKSLLGDYSDGLSVIKELVQNADDAGASEVRFLFDERVSSSSLDRLFDQGMREVQGPALWAYNNALFTADDFNNIVKLSGATKEGQRDKIGQFGLGFNTVYNLTDVPSFLSGDSIVFLDPHLKHLGKVVSDKSKPGIKLSISKNRKTLQHFSDQFEPFNGIYECDMSTTQGQSYNGTLFRFPLRTPNQAAQSEICKTAYQRRDVIELFRILTQSSETILLFTQNVTRVVVDHLPNDAVDPSKPERWFSIEKENAIEEIRPNAFGHNVMHSSAKMVVSHSLGELSQSEVLCMKIYCTDLGMQHFCGFASSSTFWYVGTAFGKGKSLSFARQDNRVLPIAGIAAPCTKEDGRFVPRPVAGDGQVFCFLPLPQTTKLPVHINGYFSVSSSRRSIQVPDKHDKVDDRSTWNRLLVEDALTDAYVNFLVDMQRLSDISDFQSVFDLWPQTSPNANHLISWLMSSFLNRICSIDGPLVFPTHPQWVNLCRLVTLDRQACQGVSPYTFETMLRVFGSINSLLCDNTVVDIPLRIQTLLQQHPNSRFIDNFLNKDSFYKEVFIPHIAKVERKDRDHLIAACLSCPGDSSIHALLEVSKCIPVLPCGEHLVQPKSLIHPEGEVHILFDVCDGLFPGFICDDVSMMSSCMSKLEQMGMSTDTLSWEQIASRCATLNSRNVDNKMVCSRLLVRLMDKNLRSGKRPSDAVAKQIMNAPFLSVMPQDKDNAGLPWKGNACNDLLPPVEMYHSKMKYLVSCIKPILHPDICLEGSWGQKEASTFLGISGREVTPLEALQQLKSIIALPLSPKSRDEFAKICHAVYRWFDKYIEKNKMLPADIDKELRSIPCILHTTQFVSPEICAFICSTDCCPLLYPITVEFEKYGKFLKSIGVKRTFSAEDYIKVLQTVAIELQQNGTKLNENMLIKATNIVKKIGEIVCSQELSIEPLLRQHGILYLPTQDNDMTDSTKLCYNNCPWVQVKDTIICHSSIAHSHASRLGVKTIRQEVIQNNSHGIPFGQKEKLVNRINRILSGYPLDESIMKELLQNADDAGATEVHFILDSRTHTSERLFDDSWKALQGPALCVYNNKCFTESDINGIQNLGEGSKSHDPCKTGQYGVGFNCVYHLTDTPTFLTCVTGQGKRLCAFDPNCKYLPGSTSAEPGQMYKLTPDFEKQFAGVVEPFMQDEYDIENGTMFRLPLRSETMVRNTELKCASVTPGRIRELFQSFKEDMSTMLLFVNNIRKIVLNEVDKTGRVRPIHTVQANISRQDEIKMRSFVNEVRIAAKALQARKLQLSDVQGRRILYTMNVSSLAIDNQWLIIQQFGYDNPRDLSEELKSGYDRDELALLPRAGVALHIGNKTEDRHRLFSFLPMPVSVMLPVHINGHFALEHENRRGLWDNGNDTRTMWNKHMMSSIVAPAYASMIMETRANVDGTQLETVEQYLKLFPNVPESDDKLFGLGIHVYRYIARHQLEIMPVIKTKVNQRVHWVAVSHEDNLRCGYFDTISTEIGTEEVEHSKSKKSTKKLEMCAMIRHVVTNMGLNLIFDCSVVMSNFRKAEVQILEFSPVVCLEYCRSNVGRVGPFPIRLRGSFLIDITTAHAFLSYCSKSMDFVSRLHGTPLLITADHMVRIFSTDYPVYVTSYLDLLPHSSEFFLHNMLISLVPQMDVVQEKLANMFSLCEFSQHLSNELDMTLFFGKDKIVQHHPKASPKATWLKRVWAFIASCVWDHHLDREATMHSIFDSMRALHEWCLLPAFTGQQKWLLPVGRANATFDPNAGDRLSRGLREAFQNCGMYAANFELLDIEPMRKSLITQILGHIDRPDSMVIGLHYIMQNGIQRYDQLSTSARRVLLGYFSQHVESIEHVPEAFEVLPSLPIYETVSGKNVTAGQDCVYVIPDIPTVDVEIWTSPNNSGTVFLKNKKEIEQLRSLLNCKFLSAEEIYCGFLFLQFDLMTERGRLEHLEYIKDVLLLKVLESNQTALIEGLKQLHFLPDPHGQLRPACEFYNPLEEVFVEMGEQVPSGQYGCLAWHEFLGHCGMHMTVTPERVIAYAKQIEQDALNDKTDHQTHTHQSRVLIRHITDRLDLLKENLLDHIKSVKFIPPHIINPEWHDICPQYGKVSSAKGFIKFEGACLESEAMFMWSLSSILPKWSSNFHSPDSPKCNQVVRARLGINCCPSSADVAQHLVNICASQRGSFAQSSALLDIIISIFERLKDLHKNDGQCGFTPILAQANCVPVELDDQTYLLIKPSQIVRKLELEIKPYLCKFPKELWRCEQLLLAIGAHQTCQTSQYAGVLKVIYKDTKQTEIKPNMKRIVQQCLQGLFATYREDTKLESLYLPAREPNSEAFKMFNGNMIIYKDSDRWDSRIEKLHKPFFVDSIMDNGLSSSEIKMFFKMMGPAIAPKLLTDIISEALVAETDDFDQDVIFASKLKSDSFIHAMTSIIQYSKCQTMSSTQVANVLSSITVGRRQSLTTFLSVDGTRIEQSEDEVSFYTIHRPNEHIVLLKTSSETKNIARGLCDTLIALFELEEVSMRAGRAIEDLITCEPSKEGKVLEDNGIPITFSDHLSFMPQTGSFVPIRLHGGLMQAFSQFAPDEIVAVKIGNEELDEEPVYIFGRVIVSDDHPAKLGMHKVFTSASSIENIASYRLYRFKDDLFSRDALTPETNAWLGGQTDDESWEEVKRIIEESSKLLPSDKLKVYKRLYLHWHPDANNGSDISWRIFNYLEQEIDSMETDGIKLASSQSAQLSAEYGSTSGRGSVGSYLKQCYQNHKRQQGIYETQKKRAKSRRRNRKGGFYVSNVLSGSNPQPGESRRWIRQARFDLEAAHGDLCTFPEWVAQKCYQAVEKSLLAAQNAIDADSASSVPLPSLNLDIKQLSEYGRSCVKRLDTMCRDRHAAIYPSHNTFPHTPHDTTSAEEAQDCLQLAKTIVDDIQEMLDSTSFMS